MSQSTIFQSCRDGEYKVEDEFYYPSSKNKGADQLRRYYKADLHLCFRICKLFALRKLAHVINRDVFNFKK